MITSKIDAYILDVLMADLVGHDHKPSAYLTYLAIWAAGQGNAVALSYSELAERTGLSKRAVQYSVAHLRRRALLTVTTKGRTETPKYQPLTPWRHRERTAPGG